MREIVLDTETTGVDPTSGHRIVEIGCLELMNHVPTSRTFHRYINPERDIPDDVVAVHGITNEKVAGSPIFAAIVGEFFEFIEDAPLVIHNADFDMRFLNMEVSRLGHPPFPLERALCTLKLTRRKYPGAPASLDALCQRFRVDNSNRTLHGALLDAQLLAEVYMELLGGRQSALGLTSAEAVALVETIVERVIRPARHFAPNETELAAHTAMLAELKNAVWLTS